MTGSLGLTIKFEKQGARSKGGASVLNLWLHVPAPNLVVPKDGQPNGCKALQEEVFAWTGVCSSLDRILLLHLNEGKIFHGWSIVHVWRRMRKDGPTATLCRLQAPATGQRMAQTALQVPLHTWFMQCGQSLRWQIRRTTSHELAWLTCISLAQTLHLLLLWSVAALFDEVGSLACPIAPQESQSTLHLSGRAETRRSSRGGCRWGRGGCCLWRRACWWNMTWQLERPLESSS